MKNRTQKYVRDIDGKDDADDIEPIDTISRL